MGQSPLSENEKETESSVLSANEKQVFASRLLECSVPLSESLIRSLLALDQCEATLISRLLVRTAASAALDANSLLTACLLLLQRVFISDYGKVIANAMSGGEDKVAAKDVHILFNLLLRKASGVRVENQCQHSGDEPQLVVSTKENPGKDTQLTPSEGSAQNLAPRAALHDDDEGHKGDKPRNSLDLSLKRNTPSKLENDFSNEAMSLLRFVDTTISTENIVAFTIDTEVCTTAFNKLRPILKAGFSSLFASLFEKPTIPVPFEGSSPMTNATRALITMALSQSLSIPHITPHNLVKLYDGLSAGFSLRSLETSVLKWHAPSILLVQGKRLSRKTRASNRRYLQFEERFPSVKDSKIADDLSRKGDEMTFAVVLASPWKKSEKTKFGDVNTTLMSILPVFDMFTAKASQPSLVSFSPTMGIGVGNDLPSLIKTLAPPYLAGDISLTIEPNLEYAVWRHLGKTGGSSSFSPGIHPVLATQDYELRFSIRSLQVWGIGTDEQLNEQRRQWEWENQQAQARQNINVDALGDDRAFLEMAGLVGNHGAGGLV